MKKLYLLFLWHQHQPVYKNPLTGYYEMPWVLLHAIKDYYEIPWHISRFEKIKATINLVPSLIKQLRDYEEENVKCKFLEIWKKPVEKLTDEEKNYLIPFLFSAEHKTMIKPFPRFYQLLLKRKSSNSYKIFSNQEILDLEVLFLLSWCGNAFREKSDTVKKLIKKGSDYTQEDKEYLLKEIFLFVKQIIPFHRELEKKGKIEISTTPFYHPILPLLIDINSAKEATPEINLPKVDVSFKEDAVLHVKSAIEYFSDIFERKPSGFWPAEGSISKETVELFSKNSIVWTASDQDVLFNSLKKAEKGLLYRIYSYKGVKLFFRDKELSDLIGFTYSSWEGEKAAQDFISRLKEIYSTFSFSPIVPVILDGENAWEFYEKNGYDFFTSLYSLIEKQDWIECITFSEAVSKFSSEELTDIVAGSWIGGNFYTWIGHPEKNRGWEVLAKTKKDFENSEEELRRKAQEYMLTAEGSDWFWWYGDDHFTPFADKFDMLFRANLQKVYDIIKKEPPKDIFIPIKKKFPSPYIRKPNYFVFPVIDGEDTHYFEWLNAGIVNLLFDASAMDTSGVHLKKLYYGYDEKHLYIRIDGSIKDLLNKNYYLLIDFLGKEEKQIKLYLGEEKNVDGFCKTVSYRCKDICEIKIPFECIPFSDGKKVEISFSILENEKPVERVPFYNFVVLDLSENFEDEWYI